MESPLYAIVDSGTGRAEGLIGIGDISQHHGRLMIRHVLYGNGMRKSAKGMHVLLRDDSAFDGAGGEGEETRPWRSQICPPSSLPPPPMQGRERGAGPFLAKARRESLPLPQCKGWGGGGELWRASTFGLLKNLVKGYQQLFGRIGLLPSPTPPSDQCFHR